MSVSKYKSRGALSNPDVRFHERQTEAVDDDWFQGEPEDKIKTELINS